MSDEIVFTSIEEMWLSPPEVINCFIDPGLLPTGGLLVITGEPGVGKSFLVQQTAFELATGRRLLGLFPTRREKTVYCEFEKGTPIARSRFTDPRWKIHYSGAIGYLHYYDKSVPDLSNPREVESFTEALHNFGSKIAIIDSYSVMIDDELNLSEQRNIILTYRRIANELKMSFILIQHLKKKGRDYNRNTGGYQAAPLEMNDLRGSKTIQYEVDTIIGLVVDKRKGFRQLGFLKHSHCPMLLSEEPPIILRFDGSSATPFTPSEENLAAVMSNLKELGPTSFVDMETILGVSRPTLLKIIERLQNLGIADVDYLGHEKYVVFP